MNCEEVLSLYETVAGITGQMLVAAREGELRALCGELVAARSVNPPGRTVEAAANPQRLIIGAACARMRREWFAVG